jgi:hypothetical protein
MVKALSRCGTVMYHLLVYKPLHIHSKIKASSLNQTICCAVYVTAYWITGVIVYEHGEGWDLLDCIYYLFIATSTVGFGDFVPTAVPHVFNVYLVFHVCFILGEFTLFSSRYSVHANQCY